MCKMALVQNTVSSLSDIPLCAPKIVTFIQYTVMHSRLKSFEFSAYVYAIARPKH